MTVEPGQGPKSELFACWISTVTSKYLSPGVNWGKGEGGGMIWVSVGKEERSVASNRLWSGKIFSQWRGGRGRERRKLLWLILQKKRKNEKTLTLCLMVRGDWWSYAMLIPGKNRNHRCLLSLLSTKEINELFKSMIKAWNFPQHLWP